MGTIEQRTSGHHGALTSLREGASRAESSQEASSHQSSEREVLNQRASFLPRSPNPELRHEAWQYGGAKAPGEPLRQAPSPDRTPSLMSPLRKRTNQSGLDQRIRNTFDRVPGYTLLLRQAHQIIHILRMYEKRQWCIATLQERDTQRHLRNPQFPGRRHEQSQSPTLPRGQVRTCPERASGSSMA